MLRVEKSTISVPRINQLGGVKKNRNSEKRQSNNEFFFIFIYLGKIVAGTSIYLCIIRFFNAARGGANMCQKGLGIENFNVGPVIL